MNSYDANLHIRQLTGKTIHEIPEGSCDVFGWIAKGVVWYSAMVACGMFL